ncbi:hypothetical protein ACIGCK_05295 [Microbacterium sp. NPDC078428]|uniref:hypothetical protein n=1 Tax=Microbacterium sp. NPDC078428 TaxID=3364190 RepID=UPI0037CA2A20
MTETPWWATPLVAGVFTLLGIAIAQLVALRLERRRHRREDERRLDAALRPAALAYLDALQRYATFVTSLTVGEVLITGRPSVVGVEDEFMRWSKHAHAIDDALAQLSLAASSKVLAAANRVQEPMHVFNLAAQGRPMTERLKYSHADEVYTLAPQFRNVVRLRLGLDQLPEPRTSLAAHAKD